MGGRGRGGAPRVWGLAAVAVTALLLAGCSSAPALGPAPAAPPPPTTVVPVPPGAVPGPAAVGIAEAGADPTKRFVLTAGEPAGCLESQGGSRASGETVLDGRAVLGRCRPVEGQAWSFRAEPGGLYRLSNRPSNRTGGAELCFEGAPRIAPDGTANTPCSRSAGQVWHVVATSAGFHRLRTDASDQRCLGVTPGAAGPPEIAMVPCEPLERAPGAPRSAQDWELTPAPVLPEPRRSTPAPKPTRATPTPPRPRAGAGATDELLAQVNAQRARAGCGPVRRDARLDRAADGHGRWMASSGELSHTGRGGSSPSERVEAEGWNGGYGENIAEGQTSTSEVMTDWMNSPGHRRNILDCEFTSVGLARVGSAGGEKWVQNFGSN